MITLTVLSGPDAGRVFTLDNDAIVIGRSSACDVMLHDAALGRRHSEIRHEGGKVLLTDLGSVNGTFVNDQQERVTTYVLKNRDEISFGKSRLRIEFLEIKENFTVSVATPGNAPPQLLLRVIEGKDTGRVFELQPGVTHFTVGRGQEANFILEDRRVSRIHFSVEATPAGFVLIDESSLNGTFVNDNPTRINRLELRGGEILRLSETRIQVETSRLGDATVFAAFPQPVTPTQPSTLTERTAPPDLLSKQDEASPPFVFLSESFPFWTAFAMLMLATASAALFLRFNEALFFSSGPVAAGHAKWEGKCVTCHPPWGVQPVNATCGITDCHANVLQVNAQKRDDCAACHTEHRGRNFNLTGDAARCWTCHEAEFSNRLVWRYYQQIATVPGEKGAVSFPLALSLHDDERKALQQSAPQQETGLIFAHTAHAKSSGQENCQTCHQPLPGAVINALGTVSAFPSHEECIRCHGEVGDRDPQVASTRVSVQCRKCHTREDRKVTRAPRTLSYVQFSHDNHQATDCVVCHFTVAGESRYHPGLRSTVYPLPMEACISCHKERQATVSCLDCHRTHHGFTPETRTGLDWLRYISLGTALLALLALEAGAGISIYFLQRPVHS